MTTKLTRVRYSTEQLQLRHELDNEYNQFLRLKQTMVEIGIVTPDMPPKTVADIIEAVIISDVARVADIREAYEDKRKKWMFSEFDAGVVVGGFKRGQLVHPQAHYPVNIQAVPKSGSALAIQAMQSTNRTIRDKLNATLHKLVYDLSSGTLTELSIEKQDTSAPTGDVTDDK